MNDRLRSECKIIRGVNSADAATWLISTYPAGSMESGVAIALMPHRSWKRRDQIRLAEHYLQRIPFAHGGGYAAFLSFMSIPIFIYIIRRHLPEDISRLSLLMYYLKPALLKTATTQRDKERVAAFIGDVERLMAD